MKKDEHFSMNEEVFSLLRGMNKRERTLHRLHCVALVLGGMPAQQVSAFYGDAPRAIAYWVTRFKTKGFSGFGETKVRGRLPRLDSSQLKRLQRFIQTEQKKGKRVNADTLAAHIKKTFDVVFARRQCWRLIRQLS
jgi:transposase